MSDVGQCWDNAPGESIWSSLKRETLMGKRKFRDHCNAYRNVERWISNYIDADHIPPWECDRR